MPDFRTHAVNVPSPGCVYGQDTVVLGMFLRDVTELNKEAKNFRVFGPDETLSNLLGAVFDVTNRQWDAREQENDEFLAPAGRVLVAESHSGIAVATQNCFAQLRTRVARMAAGSQRVHPPRPGVPRPCD